MWKSSSAPTLKIRQKVKAEFTYSSNNPKVILMMAQMTIYVGVVHTDDLSNPFTLRHASPQLCPVLVPLSLLIFYNFIFLSRAGCSSPKGRQVHLSNQETYKHIFMHLNFGIKKLLLGLLIMWQNKGPQINIMKFCVGWMWK